MKWKYSLLYCKHRNTCSLYFFNAIRKQVFGRIFHLAWPINKKRNQINQKRNESGNQLLFSPTKCSFFCSFFLGLHRINFYFHFFGKAYNFSPAFSNNVFVLLLLFTSSHQRNYASRCTALLDSFAIFSELKHIPIAFQYSCSKINENLFKGLDTGEEAESHHWQVARIVREIGSNCLLSSEGHKD